MENARSSHVVEKVEYVEESHLMGTVRSPMEDAMVRTGSPMEEAPFMEMIQDQVSARVMEEEKPNGAKDSVAESVAESREEPAHCGLDQTRIET